MATQTFNTSTSWTCPAGVTSVKATCRAAGGAGGKGTGVDLPGGGGGGGAYSQKNSIAVTPGNSYNVTVGVGASEADGGYSQFVGNSGVYCRALGGIYPGASITGAPGGSGPSSVGDTKYSGGAGGAGYAEEVCAGGGGGEGAGSSANGSSGVDADILGAGNGGSGGDGGNGGKGGATGTNAAVGVAPGGGGGGTHWAQWNTSVAGGNGQVILEWTTPTVTGTAAVTAAAPTVASSGVILAMASPAPGSALTSETPTFTWTAIPEVSEYQIWFGNAPGGFEYGSSGIITSPSHQHTLPVDGRTIYVRLYANVGGDWQCRDYTYTAVDIVAHMTSPTPSTTLAGRVVTFNWSAALNAEAYSLWIGSTPGGLQYGGPQIAVPNTSYEATLPCAGAPLYVRLWTMVAGVWYYIDYSYTAADLIAHITNLTPGQTLPGDPITFNWSAGGAGTEQYSVWIGTTPGGYQFGAPITNPPDTSLTNAVPSTGGTVYVRMWTRFGAADWQYVDYTYTAPNLSAVLSSPADGSTLSDETETLSWNSISGATEYVVYIGNTPGALDLGYYAVGTNLSANATGLPVDGRTLYVRLYTYTNTWRWQDYTFTAANLVSQMTSPTPGSSLDSAAVTFEWSPATAVTAQELWIGNALGGLDLVYEPSLGTGSSVEVELPVDGRTLYVRLHACVGGVWRSLDYTYTAALIATGTAAVTAAAPSVAAGGVILDMASPASGSTFTSSSQTFTWTAIPGAIIYGIYFGSTPGGQDLGVVYPETASYSATGLPIDGRTLYVRLFVLYGEDWQYRDYTYTAADHRAKITSPTPGSTLTSEQATFEWSPGTDATSYALHFGTTFGGVELGESVVGPPGTSVVKSGLPCTGGTVYVRMWTRFGAADWQYVDFSYTIANLKAQLTSPTPGSTLSGASVEFTGTPVEGASLYQFHFGSTPGGSEIGYTDLLVSASYVKSDIPVDGSLLYVRLYTFHGGVWRYLDYTFTTAFIGTGTAAVTAAAPTVAVEGVFVPLVTGEVAVNAGTAVVVIEGTVLAPPILATLALTAKRPHVRASGYFIPLLPPRSDAGVRVLSWHRPGA